MKKSGFLVLMLMSFFSFPLATAASRVEGVVAHVRWEVDSLGRFVLLVDRPGEREGSVDLAVFYVPRTTLPGDWKGDVPDAHVEFSGSRTAPGRVVVVDRTTGRCVLEIGPINGAGSQPPKEGREDGTIVLKGGKALAVYSGQALSDKAEDLAKPLPMLVEAVRSLVGAGKTSEDLLPTFEEARPERVRVMESRK